MANTAPGNAPSTAGTAPPFSLDAPGKRIFIGLLIGMFIASISQTIVGPAMPIIVADLGGVDYYSWVATAAMLVSAVAVPIVGKLSDLFGRRVFFLGGLVVFLLGSLISGLATGFWVLVAGRAVQGLGMGTIFPITQTIVGDIVPPRHRGKYQGLIGAVFGLTAIAGPLAGGIITDHFGWRWLFLLSVPVGAFALVFVAKFLTIEHTPRKATVDIRGALVLAVSLTTILLATSLGGVTFGWASPLIVGLYAAGTVTMMLFVWLQTRVDEPILPLRLFRDHVFTLSGVAAFTTSMLMFGAVIYIPVFAQGVLGANATNSGLILLPLMLGFVVVGIATGWAINKTGHYKGFMLAGIAMLGLGTYLLTRLTATSTQADLTVAMVFMGVGLGATIQQYTLIVQNSSDRADLGLATAMVQFFRNVGGTVGIAVFGTVMATGLKAAIVSHLPPAAAAKASVAGQDVSATSVLDPSTMDRIPPEVASAIRQGLADRLHEAFLLGLPMVAVVAVAVLFITPRPLLAHNPT